MLGRTHFLWRACFLQFCFRSLARASGVYVALFGGRLRKAFLLEDCGDGVAEAVDVGWCDPSDVDPTAADDVDRVFRL